MSNNNIRIGHGYDVHKLENGKKFVIGGIEIDHYKGMLPLCRYVFMLFV